MKRLLVILLAISIPACQDDLQNAQQFYDNAYQMGTLPEQTPQLMEQEWAIYRAKHPEMDETTARNQFDIIQTMSAENYDHFTAAWAERQALTNAWIKTQIEDVYAPSTVTDELIQSAINAYAFDSGNPALVTVSHILIRNDQSSTPENRKAALDKIRKELLKLPQISDDALRKAAQQLTLAGFRTDMNADLTFPRHAMSSFFGISLNYPTVVEPFARAAFELSADNNLSPVTESEFGFHLILFKSKTKETKASLEKDREFMRAKIVQQGRTFVTQNTIKALMLKAKILDSNRNSEFGANAPSQNNE